MKIFLAFLSIALFSSISAYTTQSAHAQLVKSTPAEGSISDTPPPAFIFEFSEAVRFHQAFIKKDGDKEKPLGNLPSKDAATLSIPAPSLTAGHYVLEWIVLTHESRALSGRIRFSISAGPAAESSPPP
jgi:methionine-rich copper-binding protein CopC